MSCTTVRGMRFHPCCCCICLRMPCQLVSCAPPGPRHRSAAELAAKRQSAPRQQCCLASHAFHTACSTHVFPRLACNCGLLPATSGVRHIISLRQTLDTRTPPPDHGVCSEPVPAPGAHKNSLGSAPNFQLTHLIAPNVRAIHASGHRQSACDTTLVDPPEEVDPVRLRFARGSRATKCLYSLGGPNRNR